MKSMNSNSPAGGKSIDNEMSLNREYFSPNTAANAIRAMFWHKQYKGKVPKEDIDYILKDSRWAKTYGKGNLKKAWKSIRTELKSVELQGNTWVWLLYEERN